MKGGLGPVTISKEQALEDLKTVIRDVFDDDSLAVNETLQREDVATWDSLGHIRLVSAIEDAFGVSFTIEEIESMTGVQRILDILLAKG
jgi:acyl carrier protein